MANTKNMNNVERHLEGKGEMDYDYINDILFFKVKDREYDYSIEFQNMVIDVDEEKFIVGIQIFDASNFLKMPKGNLSKIPKWKFNAKLRGKEFRIDLYYQIIRRNKIINNNIYPIIFQEMGTNLISPQSVSTVN